MKRALVSEDPPNIGHSETTPPLDATHQKEGRPDAPVSTSSTLLQLIHGLDHGAFGSFSESDLEDLRLHP